MDKWRAMQTFVRIVDDGSLTAAARSLHSSLPAVVRTLAWLEAQLRVRLLNRTTRRLALTEEGKAYLESCRHLLAELDRTEAALSAKQTEPTGALTVTAPVVLGQVYVAPAVTRFVRRYDKVSCELMLADRVVNLVEENVDVGIRVGPLADSSLVVQEVAKIRRVVVASPAYLRKHGTPRHPQELAEANCIRFPGASGPSWKFRDGARQFSVAVRGNLGFNQAPAAIEACAEGIGFGMFFSYHAAPYVAAKRLRIVLAEFETPPIPLSIVYPHARLLPLRTRLFVDWIKQDLRAAL